MQQVKAMRLIRECPGHATATLPGWTGWLPLGGLILAAFALRESLPGWVFMWVMAFALWAGCKWLVLWREINRHGLPDFWKTLVFLLLWPGMDAHRFLRGTTDQQEKLDVMPFVNLAVGLALIILVVPRLEHDLVRGWGIMCSLILILHFGLFHLLALVWQRCGIPAEPLMQSPLFATSLSDFWGRRWNTAFNQLAFEFVFRPAARAMGSRVALLATFLVSGLTHELVISVPARTGYGLPTAYFFLQGAGVLLENSEAGKQLGLQMKWPGRVFMLLLAGSPAYFLFPPAFIRAVILPMFACLHR